MQLSMFAFVAFGILLAFVQCVDEKPVAEFVIKQNNRRSRDYSIKSKANAKLDFFVKYDPQPIKKKLLLLKNDKEHFTAEDEVLHHTMSTWTIKDASDKELGKLVTTIEILASKIDANGAFGNYKLEGKFHDRDYAITKDGQKVARITMPPGHSPDTYDLTVYGDADQALMVFFTVIVDEIVQR